MEKQKASLNTLLASMHPLSNPARKANAVIPPYPIFHFSRLQYLGEKTKILDRHEYN